jgi:hypothetical protein
MKNNQVRELAHNWRTTGATVCFKGPSFCASAPVAPVPIRDGNWTVATDHHRKAPGKARHLVANLPSQLTIQTARHATVPAMVLDGEKLRKEAAEARQMADAASNQQDRDFYHPIALCKAAWTTSGAFP